jgi:hypothetical protein
MKTQATVQDQEIKKRSFWQQSDVDAVLEK